MLSQEISSGLSGTEGVMTLRITLLRYKSFALIILYTFSQWDLTYVISYSLGPWLKVAFYPLKICKCKSHFLLHGYCLFFFWQSYEVGEKKYPFMKRYFFSCDNIRYFAVWFTAWDHTPESLLIWDAQSQSSFSDISFCSFFFFLRIKFFFWGRTVLLMKCSGE